MTLTSSYKNYPVIDPPSTQELQTVEHVLRMLSSYSNDSVIEIDVGEKFFTETSDKIRSIKVSESSRVINDILENGQMYRYLKWLNKDTITLKNLAVSSFRHVLGMDEHYSDTQEYMNRIKLATSVYFSTLKKVYWADRYLKCMKFLIRLVNSNTSVPKTVVTTEGHLNTLNNIIYDPTNDAYLTFNSFSKNSNTIPINKSRVIRALPYLSDDLHLVSAVWVEDTRKILKAIFFKHITLPRYTSHNFESDLRDFYTMREDFVSPDTWIKFVKREMLKDKIVQEDILLHFVEYTLTRLMYDNTTDSEDKINKFKLHQDMLCEQIRSTREVIHIRETETLTIQEMLNKYDLEMRYEYRPLSEIRKDYKTIICCKNPEVHDHRKICRMWSVNDHIGFGNVLIGLQSYLGHITLYRLEDINPNVLLTDTNGGILLNLIYMLYTDIGIDFNPKVQDDDKFDKDGIRKLTLSTMSDAMTRRFLKAKLSISIVNVTEKHLHKDVPKGKVTGSIPDFKKKYLFQNCPVKSAFGEYAVTTSQLLKLSKYIKDNISYQKDIVNDMADVLFEMENSFSAVYGEDGNLSLETEYGQYPSGFTRWSPYTKTLVKSDHDNIHTLIGITDHRRICSYMKDGFLRLKPINFKNTLLDLITKRN